MRCAIWIQQSGTFIKCKMQKFAPLPQWLSIRVSALGLGRFAAAQHGFSASSKILEVDRTINTIV